MRKILYIDCDGTIMNDQGVISERTKKAINKFISLGNYVVLCTGGPRYFATEVAKQVNCDSYIITSNGAEVYDNINKKILKIIPISISDFIKIYKYSQLHNIRIIAVSENKEFVTKEARNNNQFFFPNKMSEVQELIAKNVIKQIMLIEKDRAKINLAKKELLQMSNTINIVNESDKKEEAWFTIGNVKTSKGSAMEFLTRYLNVNPKDTIAIGNDYNDLSMFKIAGTSVAMKNTDEFVKKKANKVTLSNNEDGVADYLEKFIEKEA